MVRPLAFLVGLVFVAALTIAFFMPREAAEHNAMLDFHKHPKALKLASDGPFGKFDRQQLQRGFAVYKEVCSACHSANLLSFRNLAEIGYDEGQVKTIAKEWSHEVPSVNPDTGEAATRPGLPTDRIPSPYPNEVAARAANNNALPPDLSLIAKAREGGPAYIYSLLTGYQDPPANLPKELQPGTGLHYNPYFANLNLAMAPPLTSDGQVTYGEGNPPATVDQMAKDVTAFLVWAAEPNLEKRRQTGWAVLGFLLFATVLAYLSYRNIWAGVKH